MAREIGAGDVRTGWDDGQVGSARVLKRRVAEPFGDAAPSERVGDIRVIEVQGLSARAIPKKRLVTVERHDKPVARVIVHDVDRLRHDGGIIEWRAMPCNDLTGSL